MAIFIYRNGAQEGPYEIEDLREALRSGSLTGNDLAWSEGMADWAPLRNILPESLSGSNPAEVPAATSKTDPLSIWSLVLGILSWIFSIIAGIPAIICGHLSLKRVKANTQLGGKGMAISGLVLGYLSILLFLLVILPILAIPLMSGEVSRAKETLSLNNARMIGIALQSAALDAYASGEKGEGWPADAGSRTATEVGQRLVAGDYLTKEDLEKIGLENFLIGNVAEEDPADTILIKSKTPISGASVVILKSGDGSIVKDGKAQYGADPPRDPPFLE